MFFLKDLPLKIFSFVKLLPGWSLKNFKWLLLFIPIALCIVLFFLFTGNVFGWEDEDICKKHLEIVHPAFLALSVLTALAGFLKMREGSILFVGLLALFALSRELMGQGSSFVFILGLFGLIYFGMKNPGKVTGLVSSKWAQSCLGMTFFCYLVSQLLDRGVIKRIGWLIFWDRSWVVPYSSNFEECLEALGGLFIIITVTILISCRKDEHPV